MSISGAAATRHIRELAERQHGVVARRQLLAAGLDGGLIDERLSSGRLTLVHRGVYAVGHRRKDLRERWMAAVLACGDRAALSHSSAAHLWDLRGSRGCVEVTRASGGTSRRGIFLHQARLRGADVTREAGIMVTTIERTLLDLAARLDLRQIERAVVAADRTGRLRWGDLGRVLAEGRCRPGVGRLRMVAGAVDPGARDVRSPLEVDFLALCREAGLPTPAVNVLLEGRLVDFVWPAERVVVETDGYAYHGDRLSFERDHETTVALSAAGYDVLRATYRMLDADPGRFLDLVRRSLRRAGDRPVDSHRRLTRRPSR
jgi:Protein of unknown function (DUF559)/Transcriptional regulator, AbiEi antitoxin